MAARVSCPVCKAPVEWVEANPYRPFCSRRCKVIDLGDWAAERHVIGGSDDDIQSENSADGQRAQDRH